MHPADDELLVCRYLLVCIPETFEMELDRILHILDGLVNGLPLGETPRKGRNLRPESTFFGSVDKNGIFHLGSHLQVLEEFLLRYSRFSDSRLQQANFQFFRDRDRDELAVGHLDVDMVPFSLAGSPSGPHEGLYGVSALQPT